MITDTDPIDVETDIATVICDGCVDGDLKYARAITGTYGNSLRVFAPGDPADIICPQGHMMRIAEWADFPEDDLYDTMLDQEVGYQLIIDDRKGRFESLTGDDAADAVLQYLREEVSMKAIFNPAHIVLMRNGGATVIHRNDRLFTGEIEVIAT